MAALLKGKNLVGCDLQETFHFRRPLIPCIWSKVSSLLRKDIFGQFIHMICVFIAKCEQPRLWRDCASAQSHLSLRCSHLQRSNVYKGSTKAWVPSPTIDMCAGMFKERSFEYIKYNNVPYVPSPTQMLYHVCRVWSILFAL